MRTASALFASVVLILGIPAAHATDQTEQVLSEVHGTDEVGVGIDPDGTATAVWSETYDLKYASREANGRFGPGVPIPNVDTPSEMVMDQSPNGNAIVVWTDVGGQSANVRAAVRIGAGNGFSSGVVISGSLTNASFVDAAISNSGHAVVGWTNGGSSPAAVAATFNGTSFSGPQTLEAGSAAANTVVGIDGAGNAIAVWDHDTQNDDRIQGATASPGGTFGAPVTIEELDQGAGEPDIAVNSSGDAVLAYEDAVPAGECTGTCSIFRVETRYGNVGGTFGAVQPTLPANEPMGPGSHEVAIDDNGSAALLLSANVNSQAVVLARVSDPAGTLGPVQTLSDEDAVSGPQIGNGGLDIDAGGGEFTAVFVNDENQDGQVNEVYRAETSGRTFGAPHQVSPTVEDSVAGTEVARDASGRSVVVWDGWLEPFGLVAQASPVEGNSALTIGTTTSDNLTGSSLIDEALLGGGNDKFNGAGGNDRIFGEAGNDQLTGSGGKDLLNGAAGSDVLNGGPGVDRLIGGPGRDTCRFGKGDVLESCEKKIRT